MARSSGGEYTQFRDRVSRIIIARAENVVRDIRFNCDRAELFLKRYEVEDAAAVFNSLEERLRYLRTVLMSLNEWISVLEEAGVRLTEKGESS